MAGEVRGEGQSDENSFPAATIRSRQQRLERGSQVLFNAPVEEETLASLGGGGGEGEGGAGENSCHAWP